MFNNLLERVYERRRLIGKVFIVIVLLVIGYKMAFPSIQSVFKIVYDNNKKLPIYSVDTKEKKIAISFDASWGSEKTEGILDILDEYGIKTTFFLCGYWFDKHPDKVKDIYARGHELGNHGATHAHHGQLNYEKNQKEISEVHSMVKELIGVEMDLFRPPFGEYNNTVIEAANDLGYHVIQWSVDSHDWMNKGVDYQINQVLNHKELKEGAILLFHNDAEDTPKALPRILDKILADGYEIVPISQLIYKDNYYMDIQGTQKLAEQEK